MHGWCILLKNTHVIWQKILHGFFYSNCWLQPKERERHEKPDTERNEERTRERKSGRMERVRQTRTEHGGKERAREEKITVVVFYPFPHPAQNLIVPLLICHKPIHKKLYRALSFQLSPSNSRLNRSLFSAGNLWK